MQDKTKTQTVKFLILQRVEEPVWTGDKGEGWPFEGGAMRSLGGQEGERASQQKQQNRDRHCLTYDGLASQ